MLDRPEGYVGHITELIDTILAQVASARKNEPEELYS